MQIGAQAGSLPISNLGEDFRVSFRFGHRLLCVARGSPPDPRGFSRLKADVQTSRQPFALSIEPKLAWMSCATKARNDALSRVTFVA